MFQKNKPEVEENTFVASIRALVERAEFDEAMEILAAEMSKRPHDAEPHNLMGIVFAKKHEDDMAMKHFRAARALDPTYRPARFNMSKYASLDNDRFVGDAYEDKDCADDPDMDIQNKIVYDAQGIGHIVRR